LTHLTWLLTWEALHAVFTGNPVDCWWYSVCDTNGVGNPRVGVGAASLFVYNVLDGARHAFKTCNTDAAAFYVCLAHKVTANGKNQTQQRLQPIAASGATQWVPDINSHWGACVHTQGPTITVPTHSNTSPQSDIARPTMCERRVVVTNDITQRCWCYSTGK
jgi:hypothetical protein